MHVHTEQLPLGSYQEYRYDPTRTTTLRNAFARRMRVRFDKIQREVYDAVYTNDGFALREDDITVQQVRRGQFDFPTNSEKISAFMSWLDDLIQEELLVVRRMPQIGQGIESRWTDMYVEDSYKRGVMRSRQEMRNAGMNVPPMEQTGGIEASMSTPFHMDRVGMLYIRVYEELKGISSQMAAQISRVLSQGMIDGDNPRLIARKLRHVISGMGENLGITDTLGRFIPAKRRSEILARTEIIRAHHKGMMQEYRNWGVEGVHVMAEFRTSGDARVCSQCSGMEGNTYTLDEAENLIPVHPQCRCIVLPYEP